MNSFKNKTKWVLRVLVAVSILGGLISGIGSVQTYYKGTVTLNDVRPETLTASVLTVDETRYPNEGELVKNEKEKKVKRTELQSTQQQSPSAKKSSSPCEADGIPIIENGAIRSCKTADGNVREVVTNSTENIACTESGKFTYAGAKRPGFTPGMCIDCDTQLFILFDGVCPK